MAGKKTFTAGAVLTASDVNDYLMDQSVMYFGGTAARNSAIPTPTTGMTTYIGTTGTATIPQIETYTGSEWQTPYGLTLLANVTVSAASAFNIDNIFTSTYQNYRLMIKYNGAVASMNVEARGAGSTQTGNFFTAIYGYTYNGLTQGVFQTNTQAFSMNGGYADGRGAQSIDIFNPQLATPTVFQSNSAGESYWIGSSLNLNNNVLDGLRFSVASGTFSANIRVYGYRNS